MIDPLRCSRMYNPPKLCPTFYLRVLLAAKIIEHALEKNYRMFQDN